MNYWLTTHWPPNEDVNLEDFEPEGVYLPDGRQQAGADLAVGDKVLIYQSQTGRAEIGYVKGKKTIFRPVQGKQGIIAIAEITGNLKEIPGSEPSKYVDGSEIWWRWHADTVLVSTNGFVPLHEVNRVLGYSPNYNLRAFGDYKSGLKKLDENQFFELLKIFKEHPRKFVAIRKAKRKGSKVPHGEGGESEEHRILKEFVASNPSAILGEQGLKTVGIEYEFPTGDKADIVFEDAMGRIVGVEIETSVNDYQLEGILQAIKYRYMLALMHERKNYETRAFLVAYSVANQIRTICEEYEVEYFMIDPGSVNASWRIPKRST